MAAGTAPIASAARMGNPAEPHRRLFSPEEIASLTILCTVMVAAVCGNARLITYIWQMWRHNGKSVGVNYFLINLALGDICVGVFVCGTELLFVLFGKWEIGNTMCKASVYVQFLCLASSSFLLLAMTVDRYEAIVQPLKAFGGGGVSGGRRVTLRILACWVSAGVFATPQLFIFRVTDGREFDPVSNATVNVTKCISEGYTAGWQRKTYLIYVFAVVVLLPVTAMVVCYARIVWVICSRSRGATKDPCPVARRQPESSSSTRQTHLCVAGDCCDLQRQAAATLQQLSARRQLKAATTTDTLAAAAAAGHSRLLSRAKIKAVFMSFCVVSAFLLCWLPYFAVLLVQVYSNGAIWRDPVLNSAVEKLVLSHSVLNPILYFMFATRTPAVDRLCSACVHCCKCCCRLNNEASIYAPLPMAAVLKRRTVAAPGRQFN